VPETGVARIAGSRLTNHNIGDEEVVTGRRNQRQSKSAKCIAATDRPCFRFHSL